MGSLSVAGWSPITEAQAIREWGLAEIVSDKLETGSAPGLEPLRARVRSVSRHELTEAQWGALERLARLFRAPMLDPLAALRPEWYEGEITVEELLGARIIAYPPFVQNAPSRRLDDFCGPPHGTVPEFDRAVMNARPIILGLSISGPWCLVEGYGRCCRAIRDHRAGRFDERPIPVIAGVTPRATEWSWWR
ncbi:MAG: hypothetical protein ACE5MG_11835 [Candidatus Methylomirabilales bacterium]